MWTDACFIVGAVHDDIWADLTDHFIDIGFYTALRERTLAGVLDDLRSHQVDLIFSEPELDDGNVFQLAEAIDRHHRESSVPLIMICEGLSPFVLENALEAGIDYTVERPFRRAELEETIRAALRKK